MNMCMCVCMVEYRCSRCLKYFKRSQAVQDGERLFSPCCNMYAGTIDSDAPPRGAPRSAKGHVSRHFFRRFHCAECGHRWRGTAKKSKGQNIHCPKCKKPAHKMSKPLNQDWAEVPNRGR